MTNKFLTEYVFDPERIKDGVIDFKLDIAIRGDLAMCANTGSHKADKLYKLAGFLLDIPKEIYNYTVETAKEYFKSEDVNRLSMCIVSRLPMYYLYYDKVLCDLEGMNHPKETKLSIFCRYIEDMACKDLLVTEELLKYTLDSSMYYLHEVASIYLSEVHTEIVKVEKETGKTPSLINTDCKNDFEKVLALINNFPITKGITLTAEKGMSLKDLFAQIAEGHSNPTDAVNDFADHLRNQGVNVIVKTQTFDDNGNLIDSDEELSDEEIDKLSNEYAERDLANTSLIANLLNNVAESLQSVAKQTDDLMKQSEETKKITDDLLQTVKQNVDNQNTDKQQDNYVTMALNYANEQPEQHKVKLVKINKFTGVEASSQEFDTELDAQRWIDTVSKNLPQLVEKFEYIIERI